MIPYPWVYHFGDEDKIIGVVAEIDGLRGINVAFYIFIGFISPSKALRSFSLISKNNPATFMKIIFIIRCSNSFNTFFICLQVYFVLDHIIEVSQYLIKLFNCSVEIYLHLVLFILLVKCKGLEGLFVFLLNCQMSLFVFQMLFQVDNM